MNNNSKKANIMTWNTFRKKFNPNIYSVSDSVFGKMTVIPTMTSPDLNFRHKSVIDIDEHYDYNPPKPIQIVHDFLNVYNYSYVVYYVWRHRDFHGKSIDIFYK